MTDKPEDIRSYCNPWPPRFSEGAQREKLAGEVYVENKAGKMIAALAASLRPGSVVEVVHLGLLAPIKATTQQKRKALGERVKAILDKGGVIREVATGREAKCQGDLPVMLMEAAEFISRSGRMDAKRPRAGKPPIELTPEHREIALALWRSRLYSSSQARRDAIAERIGRRLGHGWCYLHFGPPSGPADQT